MSDDYEVTMSFERFSNFWKFFNDSSYYKYTDLVSGQSGYKFIFAYYVPNRERMSTVVDTNGYLTGVGTTWKQIPSEYFTGNSFSLIINEGSLNSFDIHLKYPASGTSTNLPITISGTAVKGYYYNGAFYEDSAHTTTITGISGNYYYDMTVYDEDDDDVTKFYYYNGSSYTGKTKAQIESEKPYFTSSGDLAVKCIFLVKTIESSEFVVAYSRFSSPVSMRKELTIPKDAVFVHIGECDYD